MESFHNNRYMAYPEAKSPSGHAASSDSETEARSPDNAAPREQRERSTSLCSLDGDAADAITALEGERAAFFKRFVIVVSGKFNQ